MPKVIELKTIKDTRGNLTVIEKMLPFSIRRVFFIYKVQGERGGHKHKRTFQALIATSGSVLIKVFTNGQMSNFLLEKPHQCLILNPEDWHTMENFTSDAVLLSLASEEYDPDDYIYEK